MAAEGIAQRMKTARQLAGLTQKEAAEALNVTERTYARWEEDVSQGYLSRLGDIASVFKTTQDELVQDREGVLLTEILAEVRAQSGKIDKLTERLSAGQSS